MGDPLPEDREEPNDNIAIAHLPHAGGSFDDAIRQCGSQ
jgi:hypothetical protein